MRNKFAECYCRHYIAQTENEIAETKKMLKQLQKRKKRYNYLLELIEKHGENYVYCFNSNYENGYEMPEMYVAPARIYK